MGIQEIIVGIVVITALIYSGRVFLRQFTRGENTSAKCADCALTKMKTSHVKKG